MMRGKVSAASQTVESGLSAQKTIKGVFRSPRACLGPQNPFPWTIASVVPREGLLKAEGRRRHGWSLAPVRQASAQPDIGVRSLPGGIAQPESVVGISNTDSLRAPRTGFSPHLVSEPRHPRGPENHIADRRPRPTSVRGEIEQRGVPEPAGKP